MEFRKKTILITGGAGFIGSNLCKKLHSDGNNIICMDNFYTGTYENIYSLVNKEYFTILNHDVINPYDFYVDEIYNLACPASPPFYQRNPVHTFKTGILGAINGLELATKWDAKILQASTSEVYGDAQVHPQVETYWGNVNPDGIRACYDESKRGAETIFFDYNRTYKTNIKIIRIFNTYGPGMNPDDGRVVSNFIIQALRNDDITVYGDGSQTRSFCYISDLMDGIIKMMNSDSTVQGPINLGNPSEFTVLELAEKIIQLTRSKSKIIFEKLPQDDPKQRKPNIEKANKQLDWKPLVSLEDGLTETINYFKEKLK